MNKEIINQAIEVIKELIRVKKSFNAINDLLRKEQSDFQFYVNPIQSNIEEKIVKLLDLIFAELGDQEVASYFLYETPISKEGGKIIWGDKEFKLKTVDDLCKYIEFLISNKE